MRKGITALSLSAVSLLAIGAAAAVFSCQEPRFSSDDFFFADNPDGITQIFAPDNYLHRMELLYYRAPCCPGYIEWFAGDDLLDSLMIWDDISVTWFASNPEYNYVHEVRGHNWSAYDSCGVVDHNFPSVTHMDIDPWWEVIIQGYEEVELGTKFPERFLPFASHYVQTSWYKETSSSGTAAFYSESELTGGGTDPWHPVPGGFDELGTVSSTWEVSLSCEMLPPF